jgi:acetyl-CoA carboxylase biotin carboxyl carrier protein
MNLKEIKEMVTLMNENGLVELEVEKEGMRIRLRKTQDEQQHYSGPVVIEKTSTGGYAQQMAPAQPVQTPPAAQAKNTVEIKAPMVGTFYRAPSPDSPPYVEIGQVIEPGQVICILEAMKLMNEIKAEIKGKVIDVLVDNAEPVEFGQPMFLIEPL